MHTISDFQMRLEIEVVAPSCVLQSLACAPNVHVYDYEWFRDKFWPKWSEYVRAVNAQIEEKPLLNSPVRGICDEITKEFATKLIKPHVVRVKIRMLVLVLRRLLLSSQLITC